MTKIVFFYEITFYTSLATNILMFTIIFTNKWNYGLLCATSKEPTKF